MQHTNSATENPAIWSSAVALVSSRIRKHTPASDTAIATRKKRRAYRPGHSKQMMKESR